MLCPDVYQNRTSFIFKFFKYSSADDDIVDLLITTKLTLYKGIYT